jgi:hypothetical protein
LGQTLPKTYAANINERYFVPEDDREILPDVLVIEKSSHVKEPAAVYSGGRLASDPPMIVRAEHEKVRERFIEIESLKESGRIVAVIEVLSPSNKRGGDGRAKYLKKQDETLNSPTHLVEIDLLREGKHTVAVPLGELRKQASFDYVVCLHRGSADSVYETWPFTVRDPLPVVHVPLAGDDPDLPIALRPLLDECYDLGNFETRIDYSIPPEPPLNEQDSAWADALLQEKGLR